MSVIAVDDDARHHAIYSPGSVLVQAPAGSGKTTLLAQRYLRLLGEVDVPERILALTFTRRAAQEMRERVMQTLHAAHLSGCPPSMKPDTWRLGVAAMAHMERQGLDLRRHPSRLRIETIDSFNAWLAGQLPITAGAGSRLTLVEQAGPLYVEAARLALDHAEEDSYGRAVERVLELDDLRWHGLVGTVSGMLGTRDSWLDLLGSGLSIGPLDEESLRRVRQRMDADLEVLVLRTLAAAVDAIGPERLAALSAQVHAASKRCESPRPELAAWCDQPGCLRAVAGDVVRWRAVSDLLLTLKGDYRSRLTKTEGFPIGCVDKQVMLDLMAELERTGSVRRLLLDIRALPDPAYDEAQWSRVREVAQVLVLAAAHLKGVFRQRGMVDFPAVAMAARTALGTAQAPSDLNLRLDYRLQHILVDEFQDTSSGQIDLLKRLTAGWQRGDGRSIFCVGDPMQSIYAFRQAEVRAFLELAEDGIGDVRFDVDRLRSNFRSAPALVNWINAHFSRILPRADDRQRGAIAFRPSEAAMPAGDGVAGVSLRGYPSRRSEADGIAKLIAQRVAEQPAWRIAVLVRARAHARDLAAGLRARGVAFRAVDMEPLKDLPVVRDLVMLLCALLHGGDRAAWFALLRAPWCGLTLADLLLLAKARGTVWEALCDATVVANMSADGRVRCERTVRILESAFRARGRESVARWVELTWLALGGASCCGGPDQLEHAGVVFARLRALEEGGLPDAAELASSFDDLYAQHGVAASVEIMTIHKSKGLEFDLVVVPSLHRHSARNRDQFLMTHQFATRHGEGLVMAARPGVGSSPDRLFEFLRRQRRDASALEAERLLYVACTRAKWQLHLGAVVGRDEPDDAESEVPEREAWHPPVGSLLAVLWPVAAEAFALGAADVAVEETPPRAPRGGPLRRVPLEWSPDVATADLAAEEPAPSDRREETPVFDWAGETARRVGTLVHAELQAMDLAASDAQGIRARADQYRRWLTLHGVPAELLEAASRQVMAALIAVQGDARGRWILRGGYRDDVREHALSGRTSAGVVRAVFDRSFIDGGTRWVIDYKTSHHAGGSLDAFLDEEVIRYTPQLHRYAELARRLGPEPVRVGLYFPLFGGWREWEPAGATRGELSDDARIRSE